MKKRFRHHLALVAALCAVLGLLPVGAATGAPRMRDRAPAALTDEVVPVGAVGDIACEAPPGFNERSCQYDDVGLLAQSAGLGAFLPLGDIQYESGGLSAFDAYYDPWFGPLNPISHPVPGNHEYFAPNTSAQGYFGYFGSAAGAPGAGYYSFDVGAWHVVALNSELCYPASTGACKVGGAQHSWLQTDLQQHPNTTHPCTIAYMHRPRFVPVPGGATKADANLKPMWDLLYAARADIVLAGHTHNYQRWKQINVSGSPDPGRGIRQFVVGTGGKEFHTLPSSLPPAIDSAQARAFGILKLTLKPGAYTFRWLSAGGQPAFKDRASDVPCV